MSSNLRSQIIAVCIRSWYWILFGCLGLMIVTGFEIHGWVAVFGFETAIRIHKFGVYSLLLVVPIVIVVSLFLSDFQVKLRDLIIGGMILLFQFITGLSYLGYNHWQTYNVNISLKTIAYFHSIGAFVVICCSMIYVYRACVLPRLSRARAAGLRLYFEDVNSGLSPRLGQKTYADRF